MLVEDLWVRELLGDPVDKVGQWVQEGLWGQGVQWDLVQEGLEDLRT